MFVSGSYMQNKSVLIATNWQKLTAKATIDHRFTDFIRTGVDIGYNRIVDDGVPTGGEGTSQVAGVITSALTALPFEFDETAVQASRSPRSTLISTTITGIRSTSPMRPNSPNASTE